MNIQEATFGAGCFWCVEACFSELDGVIKVVSGYAGGHVNNPTYKEVCTGATGHAEVVHITYNEDEISFEELLEVFWFVHNPTTLNRQGNDIGTQYRSSIFYHSQAQKETAEQIKQTLEDQKVWNDPIVTEILEINNYFDAEDYHQNYLELNPDNPYCAAVSRPKLLKFREVFADRLK
jgi:peptide-methionine (S)-S-oxide reductase